MKLYLIALICMSFTTQTLAAQSAKVILVKGKVTQLPPGSMKASIVKKGDRIKEDTSLVTGGKSFIKLQFADKSIMNMGPKSKTILAKMPKDKANMVNLLTGIIKAEVNKNTKKKTSTKMLIKTKTAIMGVRGTKFQTTFNPINNNTSLVTVEGNVAMVKTDGDAVKEAIKESNESFREIEVSGQEITKPSPVISEVEALDKVFEESAEVVEVPAGRYAGVTKAIAKETPKIIAPVKIAPKQYNALAKSMGSSKKAEEVMKVTAEDKKMDAEITKSLGDAAPRSGGFVDFNSGLYVAPAETAKLNKKTGTFQEPTLGNINEKTGDYIPPKGVKIDAKKGFVIDQKASEEIAMADKEKLSQQIKVLNKGVEKQIVVNKMESKSKSSNSFGWLPDNHIVSFHFRPYSEVLTVENKDSGSDAAFYTEEAYWVYLELKQEWNSKWSSRIRVGGQTYKIDASDVNLSSDNSDGDDSYFSIGAGYKVSNKVSVFVDMVDRVESYVVPAGGDGVRIESRSISTIDITGEYYFTDWKNLKLWGTAAVNLPTGKDDIAPSFEGQQKTDFLGLSTSANGYYAWKPNLGLNTSLWYQRITAENDNFAFTRNSFGLGLELIYDI